MSERRQAIRRRVLIGGRIVHQYMPSDTACLIRNLSDAGARLVVSAAIALPARFDLVVDSRAAVRSAEAVWRDGDEIGVRFRDNAAANGVGDALGAGPTDGGADAVGGPT